MKVCPSLSVRCWAASRAIMSVLPPAANGTTTVTGRTGASAAWAGSGRAAQSAAWPGSERTASITAGAIIMINARLGRMPLWLSERADGPEHNRQGERQQHERGNDDARGGDAEPVANKTIDHWRARPCPNGGRIKNTEGTRATLRRDQLGHGAVQHGGCPVQHDADEREQRKRGVQLERQQRDDQSRG